MQIDVNDAIQVILGGGLLTSVILWWTSRHKPKVDRNAATVEGMDRFMQRLQEDNDDLRESIRELKADVAARIEELERRHEERATELRQQIEDMDTEMHRVRAALSAARAYIGMLLSSWREHLPDVKPPEPPEGYETA